VASILRQRASDVVGLLEAPVVVASHEACIAVGFDALTLVVGHGFTPLSMSPIHAGVASMNTTRKVELK
jgi:hypothetical protein